MPDYIKSVTAKCTSRKSSRISVFQVGNLDFVFLFVNSVPGRIDSRAAGVELLCPPTEDLYLGHHRQGAGIWVTVLWEHSHTNTQL